MTMFKIERNGTELSITFNKGVYEARNNGRVFFQHDDYETVRYMLLG